MNRSPSPSSFWQAGRGRSITEEKKGRVLFGKIDTMLPQLKPVTTFCVVCYMLRGFAIGRQIRKGVQGFELREPQSIYNSFFEVEKKDIEGKNLRFWSI